MFALCLMVGGVVAVNAQDTTSTQTPTHPETQYQTQDPQGPEQDRERIQTTDLPDAVKKSLEGQEYRGWLINGAYKAKGSSEGDMGQTETETDAETQTETETESGTEEEVYIIELKNGAETKTVKFDKDGNKIEGMDEEQDDQK